jgi:hypothetical protein
MSKAIKYGVSVESATSRDENEIAASPITVPVSWMRGQGTRGEQFAKERASPAPTTCFIGTGIERGCREGITKCSLGGTHLFSPKFGGEIVPTSRHRLDPSLFHRYAIGDWIVD